MAIVHYSKTDQWIRAGFACECTYRDRGRCGLSAYLEEHHLIPLGRSGKRRGRKGEGPTAMVCTRCHRRIEHQTHPDEVEHGLTWLWRATLPDGAFAFVDDGGTCRKPTDRIAAVEAGDAPPDVELWQNIGADEERIAYLADQDFDRAYREAQNLYLRMGEDLLTLYTNNRFHHLGSGIEAESPDRALEEYAQQKKIKLRYLREMMNAYRRFRTCLTPQQQERVSRLEGAYRLTRDAGASIEKLAQDGRTGDIDRIIDTAESNGRTPEAIRLARTLVKPPDPPRYDRTATVTGARLVGIYAEVKVDSDGQAETGRAAPDHVDLRLRQHSYIAGVDRDFTVRVRCEKCDHEMHVDPQKLHVATPEDPDEG